MNDADQYRLRCEIIVPDVVVNRLEVPFSLAAVATQAHQTVTIEIGAPSVAAIHVVGRRCQGNEDRSPFCVHARGGPGVGAAAFLPRIAFPCFVAELARLRNSVKTPQQFATSSIQAENVSTGALRRAVTDQ
jgi:hypothetical protein